MQKSLNVELRRCYEGINSSFTLICMLFVAFWPFVEILLKCDSNFVQLSQTEAYVVVWVLAIWAPLMK
jgi:hypothetical protein